VHVTELNAMQNELNKKVCIVWKFIMKDTDEERNWKDIMSLVMWIFKTETKLL
jgi:hypothetical protein